MPRMLATVPDAVTSVQDLTLSRGAESVEDRLRCTVTRRDQINHAGLELLLLDCL